METEYLRFGVGGTQSLTELSKRCEVDLIKCDVHIGKHLDSYGWWKCSKDGVSC